MSFLTHNKLSLCTCKQGYSSGGRDFIVVLTWRVSLVEQELLTLPEHLRSSPVFSGIRVTRSLVLYVCFVYRCLSFCTFPFGHCVVCSSSIYGFWLPLWYLQTLLVCIKQCLNTKCCAAMSFSAFKSMTGSYFHFNVSMNGDL